MNQSNLSRKTFIRLYFSYKIFLQYSARHGWHWGNPRCNPRCNLEQLAKPRPGSSGVLEDATNKQKQKHPQLKIWQTIQCYLCFHTEEHQKLLFTTCFSSVEQCSQSHTVHIWWFLEDNSQSEAICLDRIHSPLKTLEFLFSAVLRAHESHNLINKVQIRCK